MVLHSFKHWLSMKRTTMSVTSLGFSESEDESYDSTNSEISQENSISCSEINESVHSGTDFSLESNEAINDNRPRKQSQPEFSEKIADKIISVFIIKRPLRLIDKESKDAEISYEESEERLISLLFLFAVILLLLSSSLSSQMMIKQRNQHVNKPWDAIQSQDPKDKPFPTFNFIIMDQEGNLESFMLVNQRTLKLNYKLKLPKPGSNNEHTYFLYVEKGEVYVVNGKMKITKLTSNGKHRTIPDSSMPYAPTMLSSTSIRIGKFFWILGRNNDRHNENIENVVDQVGSHFWSVEGMKVSFGSLFKLQESHFWSIERLKWFPGPALEGDAWFNPSGTAINRTFGLILSPHNLGVYTGFYFLNLDPFSFLNNSKFLNHGPDAVDFNFPSSTCIVTKRLEKKVYYGQNIWKTGKQQFYLYEIDIDTLEWKQVQVPMIEFGPPNLPNPNLNKNQGMVTSIKGQLYLFSMYTKKVFYMDSKNGSWQEFERDGNITDIFTILPYQV